MFSFLNECNAAKFQLVKAQFKYARIFVGYQVYTFDSSYFVLHASQLQSRGLWLALQNHKFMPKPKKIRAYLD